jgi:limonene-1,2-epoxide hydrolase
VSDAEQRRASIAVVQELWDAIYTLDFDAAVELFTDDGSYHDLALPIPPAVGKEAIRRKLDFMLLGGVERMTYEVQHMVADGDIVLCERSETWHFPSGATPTLRVMCTIELREGRIAQWREYWNHSELMDAMPPEFFAGVSGTESPPTT